MITNPYEVQAIVAVITLCGVIVYWMVSGPRPMKFFLAAGLFLALSIAAAVFQAFPGGDSLYVAAFENVTFGVTVGLSIGAFAAMFWLRRVV